jgi:tetratricopeptide (TPR) repeat protein
MLGTVALSKQREPTGLSDFCRWHAGYKLPLIATFMCLHGSGASTNHVSVPDSSQKPASRPALVSHRARLVLPEADLSQLELTVQQRLRAGEANLVSLITQPTVSEKDLAEAYGHLGSLFHVHGLSETAMACYQSAQSLAPEAYRWPYLIGYLHQQNGLLGQAADAYERALHLNPNYVQV